MFTGLQRGRVQIGTWVFKRFEGSVSGDRQPRGGLRNIPFFPMAIQANVGTGTGVGVRSIRHKPISLGVNTRNKSMSVFTSEHFGTLSRSPDSATARPSVAGKKNNLNDYCTRIVGWPGHFFSRKDARAGVHGGTNPPPNKHLDLLQKRYISTN